LGLADNDLRQAVIKEAMRMHPGVGFPLERVISSQGAKLCDVDIPRGTIVSVNAWVIHQNQDIYGDDANVFRPERWLEASPEHLKLMDRYFLSASLSPTSLPFQKVRSCRADCQEKFGHCTRSCIGKNISIMEMGKLVPQILHEFDLEWASEKDEWTVTTFWFAKQTDMIVRFRPKTP
jgi:cytochrome P450